MAELNNKYRPKSLKTLAGNDALKKALEPKLKKDTLPRALLFHGDSGCGKTTVARVIARHYKITGVDFHELDAAYFSGKADTQEILQHVRTAPIESKYKMYLFDESHNLSKAAQETLLKLIEEPPKNVFFVFCTTEPKKMLETIRSRCKDFRVAPLKELEGRKFLNKILKKEELELAESVVKKIVQIAEGRPRRILTLLDKVSDIEDEIEAVKILSESNLDEDPNVFELTMTLAKGIGKQSSWKSVCKILATLKETEVEGIRRGVLNITNSMILKKGESEWTAQLFCILDAFNMSFFYTGRPGLTRACYIVLYGDDPMAAYAEDE